MPLRMPGIRQFAAHHGSPATSFLDAHVYGCHSIERRVDPRAGNEKPKYSRYGTCLFASLQHLVCRFIRLQVQAFQDFFFSHYKSAEVLCKLPPHYQIRWKLIWECILWQTFAGSGTRQVINIFADQKKSQ